MSKTMTVREVCDAFQVSESCVRAWVRRGKISSFKVNGIRRFKVEDIEAMMNVTDM